MARTRLPQGSRESLDNFPEAGIRPVMATDIPNDRATARTWAASLLRRIADGIDDAPKARSVLPDQENGLGLRTNVEVVRTTTAAPDDVADSSTTRVGGGAPPYYTGVVSCAQGCALVQNCNSNRNLPRRFLPRGTTSRAIPGKVRLMIVMANPGQPAPSEDDVYRVQETDSEVADAAWQFTERILEGDALFNLTLDKVIAEAAFVLDCAPKEVLDQCVITNHVRCSTPRPYSSYQKGTERDLRRATSATCIERHLAPEIAYWQPEKIAVFSGAAREAFDIVGVPYDAEISHPAAMGANLNRDVRRAKLVALKAQLGF
jgi:hypothetical protein